MFPRSAGLIGIAGLLPQIAVACALPTDWLSLRMMLSIVLGGITVALGLLA